jgi:1,4-alpha-glucan branching enzyme
LKLLLLNIFDITVTNPNIMTRLYFFIVLIAFAGFACQTTTSTPDVKGDTANSFPAKAAPLTIYEVNIRQHTPEGTINAFAKDLPRLKDLGVGMLWIMPVQPIGVKNRKEPLGSYYSIRNYSGINENFGTPDDFKNMVKEAHKLDIYVILDWVPNHTAWDHPWITAHPEYYAHDSVGNVVYEADWTDIALLDHTKPETRRAMIGEMKTWITDYDVDGFRCDHAGHEIPLYFWEEATAELDSLKDLFWLAEWDQPRMHLEFDASYAWELLHLTEKVAKGKANADDIDNWIKKDIKEYGRKPFRLTMITNHDENSWAGTEFERYGEGHKAFATFIFSAYGTPMIYSGQEAGNARRLRFFAKDTIDWRDSQNLRPFYKQLVTLRKENAALYSGEYGGVTERINKDADIFAFKRIKGNNRVIGIMNLSNAPKTLMLTDTSVFGKYKDYFSAKEYSLSASALELSPWQYLIFTETK